MSNIYLRWSGKGIFLQSGGCMFEPLLHIWFFFFTFKINGGKWGCWGLNLGGQGRKTCAHHLATWNWCYSLLFLLLVLFIRLTETRTEPDLKYPKPARFWFFKNFKPEPVRPDPMHNPTKSIDQERRRERREKTWERKKITITPPLITAR